ncbi:MAG: hypothetical protein EA424_03935, partial [Planctomycetaceae bacterium]
SITMIGTGGTGTGNYVEGVGILTSTITTEDGNIVIAGTGGAPASGIYDSGVRLADGSISTTGSGNIEITGTGGTGSGENYGISMGGGSAQVSATGSGNISLTGTHGTNAATTSGVQLGEFGPMSVQQTGSGWLEIIGDRILIHESNATIDAGSNTATLRPLSNNQSIDLGGADSPAQLGLTDGELDRITAGTLQIGDSNSGTITVSQSITRGSATDLHLTTGANIAFSGSGSLDSSGGDVTLTTGGTGAITSGAAATDIDAGAGAIMLAAGSGGIGASGNPVVVSSTLASALTALTAGNADQFLAATDSIGVLALSAGSGTITLADGTFKLSSAGALPDRRLVVNGQLDLNGHSPSIGGLDGSGTVTSSAAGDVILTVGTNNQGGNFSGVIQDGDGTVVLTKIGSGILTLSGANTYTGDTTVSDGILLVNGSTAAGSSVSIEDGASLGGTGSVGGTVTAEDGGTVAPGSSTGILATGSVAFESGSIFAVDINGTGVGTDYDQLDVTGTVDLDDANLDVTLGFTPEPGHSFTIINNDGADPVGGAFAGLPEGATLLVDAVPLKVSYAGGDGNDVVVSFNTNPELNGTAGDDAFFVRRVGDEIEVRAGAAYPDGTVLLQTLLVNLDTLTIDGQGGDDTLTVDFSGGDPIPTSGLTFHGGMGDDALVITGNATPFTDQVFTFTGKDSQGTGTGFDGTVDLDGSTITFTGLKPIDGGDAVNTTFNLPDVPGNPNNDIILRNHTTAGRIEIFDNTGSDFENTNVPNPTDSLTVNLGNQGDTITLLDLDDDFAPGAATNAFVINGGSGADTFHIQSTRQADGGTYSGLIIHAGDGDDVVSIGSASYSLDTILAPVFVYGDAGSNDTLVINDQSDTDVNNYVLTPTTFTRTSPTPPTTVNIFFDSTLNDLVLNADGNSTVMGPLTIGNQIAVTPSPDTRFTIHGNDPAGPVFPGDVMFYDGPAQATKSIAAPGSGTISATGVQDVVYTDIETLVHTTSAGFVDVIDMNVIEPGGDGNENVIRLVRRLDVGLGEDFLEIYVDTGSGEQLYSTQWYDGVGQISVIGNEDDDTLIIDHGGTGSGLDNGFINRTIGFVGGAGFDSLTITGDPGFVTARTSFLAGPPNPLTDFSGTWVIDPLDFYGAGAVGAAAQGFGQDAMVVNFTGLAPVADDTPATAFDAILTGGDDDATVQDAVVSGLAGLEVVSNTATFEDFAITRKDSIRLMGQSGGDVFRIDYGTAPVGSDSATPIDLIEVYGHVAPGVLGQPADDNASDRMVLFATAAGVTTRLFG